MLSRLLPARHLVRLPIVTIRQARPFSASNTVFAPIEQSSQTFDVEKVNFFKSDRSKKTLSGNKKMKSKSTLDELL